MNTLGKNLRITTFGESHGIAMGGIIDGFPSGFKIDFKKLDEFIQLRRPGTSTTVTQRKESDTPEFLSGISSDGITLGTPIGFIIRNSDSRSNDYKDIKDLYRPNHADFTYDARYGIRDYRGGGRASARETVNWVVAGGLALQWLESKGVRIQSILSQVGKVSIKEAITKELISNPSNDFELKITETLSEKMNQEILDVKKSGDSVGGIVTCVITGLPAGIGNPVFGKFHAQLAYAMMSINAAKGFEYGSGFESSKSLGSESADIFLPKSCPERRITTSTNHSGGVQGGITNGMPVFFNVAFKPTPTILKEQNTVDINGKATILRARGRHDPCVAVRAVPVVKAMAALVTADFLV